MALLYFFRSSVGLKILMALTGVILFGFVVGHMLGNLQVFMGADQLNNYGWFLHSQPELLWGVRVVLLASVVLHIVAGLGLWWHNRASRPVNYVTKTAVGSSWASRSMAISGVVVLFFIVFHILHFTVPVIDPDFGIYEDSKQRHDVFRMVVEAFSSPWIAGFYVIAVGLLCIHLSHGVSSLFRSLGWMNASYRPLEIGFARAFALFIFVGFSAVPLAVQLGFVKILQTPAVSNALTSTSGN